MGSTPSAGASGTRSSTRRATCRGSSGASAELLAGAAPHYVFVSSISVYASFAEVVDEHSPVAELSEPGSESIERDYGALKALCEDGGRGGLSRAARRPSERA